MTFSIIIPTIARQQTLPATIKSIFDQDGLGRFDEVLLVEDGPQIEWAFDRRVHRLRTEGGPHSDWGSAAKTLGMRHAIGDYLLFLDDDDEFLPGALSIVRQALRDNPKPHLFRARERKNLDHVFWQDQKVYYGNVTTQGIVFPNWPRRLGKWSGRYGEDFDFIQSTLALWPADSVVWREEIIALIGRGGVM